MKRPNARVRHGLRVIAQLAAADVQCAEPGDYSQVEREDINSALEWIGEATLTPRLVDATLVSAARVATRNMRRAKP